MSFFRRDMMEDMAGDLSDVSDVSADELAKMVGDASNLDDEIFGFGKSTTSKKDPPASKPTPPKAVQQSSPLQGRKSDVSSSRRSGLDDSLDLSLPDGDPLKPKNIFSPSRHDKKEEDNASRGDWLGLTEENKAGVSSTPALNRSLPLAKSDTGAKSAAESVGKGTAGANPSSGRRPSTSGDKASLLHDLFGSTWGQSQKTPQKTEELKEPAKVDDSYIPSLGGGTRRSAGRRRDQSPSTFNFDELDMGAPAIASLPSRNSAISSRSKIPDWLGGGDSKDLQSTKGVSDERSSIEKPKSLIPPSSDPQKETLIPTGSVQQIPPAKQAVVQFQQQQVVTSTPTATVVQPPVPNQQQPLSQPQHTSLQFSQQHQIQPLQQSVEPNLQLAAGQNQQAPLVVSLPVQQLQQQQQQQQQLVQQHIPQQQIVQPLNVQQGVPLNVNGQSNVVSFQTLPFSGNPVNFLLQANSGHEDSADSKKIVDNLASAQATLGVAMAKHHINMHSYMQVLLEEARRLTGWPSNPRRAKGGGRSRGGPNPCDSDDTRGEGVSEGEGGTEGEEEGRVTGGEEMEPSQMEKTNVDGAASLDSPTEAKEERMNTLAANHKHKRKRGTAKAHTTQPKHSTAANEMELTINELKLTLQNLEIENFNLKMKLESLKTSHEIEITSLKKSSEQDALLWETRIERIQHFCLELEKEYNRKIEKMKVNEEELLASHKAKVELLQHERISEIQQLGDLHRVILEQALSVTVMYPQYRSGGMKLPIRFPEKPSSQTEMTDREAALLDKERHLEVMKCELEAVRESWEEEKKRTKEELEEREREVRELEGEWRVKREREERELARREGRVEGLAKKVEEMREEAVSEAAGLARERLEVTTQRARLDAILRSETGEFLPNADHLLQVRAEAEAGLHESRKAQAALDSERRRQSDLERRLQHWNDELEHREREAEEKVRRAVADARDATEAAQRAEERAQAKEAEAVAKAQLLEKQLADMARDKLEIAKEKFEIDSAKSRLDLLLPELSPMESLSLRPPKNYVDPKALIMKLKAEKELEGYSLPKKKYS